MTKHILCAVDLTHEDEARAILKEAGKLASFYGAELGVITVLPDYGSSFVGSFFKEGTLKSATDAAVAALHKLVGDVLPNPEKIQHIVGQGTPYEVVLETVQRIDADMVIVGAHKPDLADRLLGPNAARIVRGSSVSVLVLRV